MNRVISATQFFRGQAEEGQERCFFCAGTCGSGIRTVDVVRDSFTALDQTMGSPYVCRGCVEAMREGVDLAAVDGVLKSNQKTRGYSWVVTRSGRVAFTKAHRMQLLGYCLVPPQPPYVICIAVSGQKHILYKAQVNLDASRSLVCLEGENIAFKSWELEQRLLLVKQFCSVVGKPRLEQGLGVMDLVNISSAFREEDELVRQYLRVRGEPLTRLAVFFCPSKEVCLEQVRGSIAATHD